MELFLIKHVPISAENNCDDNQILILTSNHFYSHLLGGHYSITTLYVLYKKNVKPVSRLNAIPFFQNDILNRKKQVGQTFLPSKSE